MGEFRQDLSTKDWVLIAEKRTGKPNDFKHEPATPEKLPEVSDTCPFCEGKGNATPVVLDQVPARNKNWQVRLVPNKYNALEHSEDMSTCDFYCRRTASGEHEVIFTRAHNRPIALQKQETVESMLDVYIDRIEKLSQHEEVKYVHIIQNHGAQAGASLAHPHSQIFTTPFIPERIQEELRGTRDYFDDHKSCLYCDIVDYEIKKDVRVVIDSESFLVMTPYASKAPYQMRILPKRHMADFREMSQKEKSELAKVLVEVMNRLYVRLENPAYNYYIHTIPSFSDRDISKSWDFEKFYHWHLVIVPRFSKFAGFELGTEVYVNVVSPEQAAELLR